MRLHIPARQVRRIALTVASVAAVMGCAPTEPTAPVVGVFALSAIEGQPLPVVIESTSILNPDAESIVLADTLKFFADGHGEWRGTSLWRAHPDSAAIESSHLLTFRHRRSGTSIDLDSLDCGADCLPGPPPYLVYSGSVVRRVHAPGYWTYTRVDGIAP